MSSFWRLPTAGCLRGKTVTKPYRIRTGGRTAVSLALKAALIAWLLATLVSVGDVLFSPQLSGEVIGFLLMSIISQPFAFALLPRKHRNRTSTRPQAAR